jgi:HK97 family phage major capsid protein
MKSKDLINEARQKFSASFMQSIKDGNEEGMAEAIAELSQNIQDALMQEANDTSADQTVLAARGVRVLTSEETKYYESMIKAMGSAKDVKAAVTNLDVAMPETIIDAVLEDIETAFPLLDEIDFRNTTAITKWFYNKQETQQAAWGKLGSEIVKELAGAIASMDLTQCKLTGYMVVSKDFLKLGPTWLDAYVRAILSEANGVALETAVVDGDGNDSPIGMTRDLTKGSTTEGATTYTRKTATKVTKLDPATYGSILAKLTKTPSGRQRTVKEVIMVVSPADYMEKVMPATTILIPQGGYVSGVLPFPTKVIQSVGMPSGHAVVGLGKRYFLGLGTSKDGLIDYSDHAQFVEDNRVYTTHLYGNGKPLDNNAFEYLDISGLEPLSYVPNTTADKE